MGQTLTHGVYLPNEGERNCYNGLAANWQLLDGAVGTVAEHTSALAGKAPLVHTHTKSQITDFPVYGTTAGTICEGNDSRLSDARTPVAHTHGKADVTDLLNSNFIPSANNSYDLGSSSYQWNNAYIKSLTINGVACGDILTHNASEFVDVSSNQTIGGSKNFSIVSASDAVIARKYVNFNDNTSIYISGGNGWNLGGQISLIGKNNITIDDSGNIVKDGGDVVLRCASNLCGIFEVVLNVNNSTKERQFSPVHNEINLGTSTNKWKSFNGINPGALSLPDYTQYEPINFSQWDTSGALTNIYTPDKNGWLFVNIKDTATNSIYIYVKSVTGAQSYSVSVYGNGSQGLAGRLATIIPVIKGLTYGVVIKAASVNDIYAAKFFPALGNV